MTDAEALAFLHDLPRFAGVADAAYKPGLDRMCALLDALGHPHEAFRSVHIAGTNGKGSTASLVAAAATAGGLRTGLHTSPHLVHVTERMRLDGQPAPAAWLADAVRRHRAAFEHVGPSFFEATTALAFLYFAEEDVDLAVVEVGLGGRLDATNVLVPAAALVTRIGLDHQHLLGATLAEIAREKGGIAKPGVPLLAGEQQEEARATLRDEAAQRGAPFAYAPEAVALEDVRQEPGVVVFDATTPHRRYEALRVGLAGRHQTQNAALALLALETTLPDLAPEAIRAGFAAVTRYAGLRGRLETAQREPLVLLDVGHNPDALAAALDAADAERPADGRLTVLLGLMQDKDAEALGALLAARDVPALTVSLEEPRACSPEVLAQRLTAGGAEAQTAGTLSEALPRWHAAAAPHDALLVAGSHVLVGAFLADAATRSGRRGGG